MEINDSNFKELSESGKPMVLDFWASWCGPCKKIAPYIQNLADKYGDRVIVGKVNIDEGTEELVEKYGIRNIPTVFFIKDGNIVDKLVGAMPESNYDEKLQALL